MSQSYVTKQVNWITRFSNASVAFMTQVDLLTALCTEYGNEAYGTGGANAITDGTVQAGNATANGPLPAATALQVAEAVGVLNGSNQILSLVATNRGYLENVRP